MKDMAKTFWLTFFPRIYLIIYSLRLSSTIQHLQHLHKTKSNGSCKNTKKYYRNNNLTKYRNLHSAAHGDLGA